MPRQLYPLLVIGALFLLMMAMRAVASSANPNAQLGAVAQSLGIAIVQGSPSYNLVLGPTPNLLFQMFGVTKHDVRVRAGGTLGNQQLSFDVHDKLLRVRLRRFTVHEADAFQATITLEPVNTPFPFEITVRGQHGLEAIPSCGFPVVAQGQGAAGSWTIASPNPAAAQYLAQHAHALASVMPAGHLIGREGKLMMPMGRHVVGLVATLLPAVRDVFFAVSAALGSPVATHTVTAPQQGYAPTQGYAPQPQHASHGQQPGYGQPPAQQQQQQSSWNGPGPGSPGQWPGPGGGAR